MNVNHGENGTVANTMDEDGDVPLPGFRFHPTDEELLRFYLRRKIDNKPMKIELIKQIDIYKYDPWDLPTESNGGGESDSYFFCKRGRKYPNSIRPNRVTGSGFWKATGIDKPIYSDRRDGHECIGLKKTLVYYQGSARKGTKTAWMMHEFRLPNNDNNTDLCYSESSPQEAEVWTICRIFKRNVSHKNYMKDWRESVAAKIHSTNKITSSPTIHNEEKYINFGPPGRVVDQIYGRRQWHAATEGQLNTIVGQPQPQTPLMASSSSFLNPENDFFTDANWDELRAVVDNAIDPFLL